MRGALGPSGSRLPTSRHPGRRHIGRLQQRRPGRSTVHSPDAMAKRRFRDFARAVDGGRSCVQVIVGAGGLCRMWQGYGPGDRQAIAGKGWTGASDVACGRIELSAHPREAPGGPAQSSLLSLIGPSGVLEQPRNNSPEPNRLPWGPRTMVPRPFLKKSSASVHGPHRERGHAGQNVVAGPTSFAAQSVSPRPSAGSQGSMGRSRFRAPNGNRNNFVRHRIPALSSQIFRQQLAIETRGATSKAASPSRSREPSRLISIVIGPCPAPRPSGPQKAAQTPSGRQIAFPFSAAARALGLVHAEHQSRNDIDRKTTPRPR